MNPQSEMFFYTLNVNEQTKRVWEDYRPKMLALVEALEKRTGKQQVVSFAEADPALLKHLHEKIGGDLPGLDPFALPDINSDFSFIALSDGEPVAFNAARTIGRKMVYEISAAQYGKSTMSQIAVRFLDKLFDSDIERVSSVVRGENNAGISHAERRFGFLFKRSGKQIIYS